MVNWSAPFGGVYQSYSLTATSSGTQCLWDSMNIAGAPKPMAGAWNENLYWNGALLASVPFAVSTAAATELIWQNAASYQVNANYYGGTGGATLTGWATLNSGRAASRRSAAAVIRRVIFRRSQSSSDRIPGGERGGRRCRSIAS